jgi:hypothetical protein
MMARRSFGTVRYGTVVKEATINKQAQQEMSGLSFLTAKPDATTLYY